MDSGADRVSDMVRVLRVFRWLRHPNIVSLYGACVQPNRGTSLFVDFTRGPNLDIYCQARSPAGPGHVQAKPTGFGLSRAKCDSVLDGVGDGDDGVAAPAVVDAWSHAPWPLYCSSFAAPFGCRLREPVPYLGACLATLSSSGDCLRHSAL